MRVLDKDTCNALIEKIKKSGGGASPDRLKQIYIIESNNQSDIDNEDGAKYTYEGGQVINAKTGKRAPDEVIKNVERDVKLILANEESSETIQTLKRIRDGR